MSGDRFGLAKFRNRCLGVVSAASVLVGPAFAQERVSPDQFLDFAVGKTLTFELFPGGGLVGVEEFLSRELSVWRDRSDQCVYGQITVTNARICFLYEDDEDGVPVCWAVYRHGPRWLVASTEGLRSEFQEIVQVSEDGLLCPGVPVV